MTSPHSADDFAEMVWCFEGGMTVPMICRRFHIGLSTLRRWARANGQEQLRAACETERSWLCRQGVQA